MQSHARDDDRLIASACPTLAVVPPPTNPGYDNIFMFCASVAELVGVWTDGRSKYILVDEDEDGTGGDVYLSLQSNR